MFSDSTEKNHKGLKKTSSDVSEQKTRGSKSKDESSSASPSTGGGKRVSEYKRQLVEKQKLKKRVYKMREKQFKRFFKLAVNTKTGETGDNFLILLERRLDNVIFRLKMSLSRLHARQMIVHGHFLLNGKHVKSPSLLVSPLDVITLTERAKNSEGVKAAFEKRMNSGVRVPEWLELDGEGFKGTMLKIPARIDIPTKSETGLIVEFYSK
jgi:small subunit ribosomal protein S4